MSVRRRFTVAMLADVESAPDADQLARLRAALKGPVAYDELSARLAASTIVQAREEFAAARRAAKRLTNVIPTARIVDEVSVRRPRGPGRTDV
jgi:hypothetical protein